MSAVRYRCAACGNITRFDVVTDRRTKAFHHFSVGGTLSVEDEQVLAEEVVEVNCRWCGHGRAIEALEDDAAGDADATGRDATGRDATGRGATERTEAAGPSA